MRPSSAAAKRARAARRRRIGLGLIAFGVTGLVLIGAAGALVLASLGAVDQAATDFEEQRAQIVGMLGPASEALEGAADSAANAGASLEQTRAAATQAAALMNRLAASFENLAALGEFEILGSRPFASLSGQFTDVATQSRTLSENLADAATAMATNVTDSQDVAADMRVLAAQLAELDASLGGDRPETEGPQASPGASPGTSSNATNASLPIDAARFVLVGLLLWLAIPAVCSIWLGWRWSRAAPEA